MINNLELMDRIPLTGTMKQWNKTEKLLNDFREKAQLDAVFDILSRVEYHAESSGDVTIFTKILDDLHEMVEQLGGEWEVDD